MCDAKEEDEEEEERKKHRNWHVGVKKRWRVCDTVDFVSSHFISLCLRFFSAHSGVWRIFVRSVIVMCSMYVCMAMSESVLGKCVHKQMNLAVPVCARALSPSVHLHSGGE